MDRAILYVDGFNFHYGVTDHWRKNGLAGLGWCNFRTLVERHFALAGATLDIKYFAAAVRVEPETPTHRKDEQKRSGIWARAVRTIGGVRVVEGFHKPKKRIAAGRDGNAEVLNPDAPSKSREEKQTDINLAIEVMLDALGPNPPRKVFLLSDDRDLMPVVFALLERITVPVEVVVLLPSRADARNWQESYQQTAARLNDLCVARRVPSPALTVVSLSEQMLASSLLGYALADSEGSFECLDEWRLDSAYLDRHCPVPEWRPEAPL